MSLNLLYSFPKIKYNKINKLITSGQEQKQKMLQANDLQGLNSWSPNLG